MGGCRVKNVNGYKSPCCCWLFVVHILRLSVFQVLTTPGAVGIGLSHVQNDGQTSQFASEARLLVKDRNYNFPFSVFNGQCITLIFGMSHVYSTSLRASTH
jgi:hypothetical protein